MEQKKIREIYKKNKKKIKKTEGKSFHFHEKYKCFKINHRT